MASNENKVPPSGKFPSLLALVAFSGMSSMGFGGVSLQISGVQNEIVGTTSEVTGSGSSSNYATNTTVGNFAIFDVAKTDGTDFADLVVRYQADNGGIGSNIMIAQTSNSQGLTDSGTISALIDVGNGGGGTVDLQFDWYAPGSFVGGVEQAGSSFITNQINYTTFDIDFQQEVSVRNADMAQYTVNGVTELTGGINSSVTTFTDSGADSTFDDPKTAVGILSRGGRDQSHLISVGKQNSDGPALFMFEFHDPSEVVTFTDPQITPIPEVSSSFVMSVLLLLPLSVRHRRRRA